MSKITAFFGTRNGKSNGSNSTLVWQRILGLPQIAEAFARRDFACDRAATAPHNTAIIKTTKGSFRKLNSSLESVAHTRQ
ncbi:MAG TPA: hypothetical protein VGW76_02860 [Pyrinomonadaceae bacterium]|nr:hypothetical protein [Pyrinomonadaceae bacterium]